MCSFQLKLKLGEVRVIAMEELDLFLLRCSLCVELLQLEGQVLESFAQELRVFCVGDQTAITPAALVAASGL